MRRGQMCTVAALAIVWSTRLTAAAVTTHDHSVQVTVRVYRAAETEPWLDAALAHAGELLSAVSLKVTWVSCDGGSAQPLLCRVAPDVGEFAVRLIRAADARVDVASMPLGDSLIDRNANAGTLATIYVNRVVWLADESRISVAMLGGRAIAHELGHLLMATSDHGTTGLMRPHWTVLELARDYPRDWMFTAGEAKTIRHRVSRDAALRDARRLQRLPAASFAVISPDVESSDMPPHQ